MKKSKIIFGIVFLVTLVLAVTHQSEFLRFLIGFELLLAVFLFFQVRFLIKRLQVRLRAGDTIVKKDGDIRIETELENKCWLPIPEIRVEVEYRDEYTGVREKTAGTVMLDGKGKAVLTFHLHPSHCGIVSFWLVQITAADYLGLFFRKFPITGSSQEVAVIPDHHKQTNQSASQTGISAIDGDEYEQNRAGDDPSQTYDIREFRYGDSLRHVHWNMTAKTGSMQVRDFSRPMENSTLILLDLMKNESDMTRQEWDHFLESAASFSYRLLRMGMAHYVAWFNTDSQTVVRQHVKKEEELTQMLFLLVHAAAYETGDIGTIYKENFADEAISEIIRIDIRGNVQREGNEDRR